MSRFDKKKLSVGNEELEVLVEAGNLKLADLAARVSALLSTGYTATAIFRATATAYDAGDVVGVAQQMVWRDKQGNIFPGGELMITSVWLEVAETAVQSGETSYLLKLYNGRPPTARADAAAWDIPVADRLAYQNDINLGSPVDLGSTLRVATDGINKQITVSGKGETFGELVTVAGFTATATERKVRLHAVGV